ncbi:MAG TPA: ATP-dependent DNA helicase RecQ [Chitinophagales bacterium]|nr:ATP-dependent DNA helicase RecQ [Chitinophagales bacterium]
MQHIEQILKQYWGFEAFRPLQEDIIKSVLAGKDTLGLLPTGGGKSVCFQVPGLAMEGLCLVVSPLIALMKDQVNNLNKKGIKAVAVHAGLSYREADALLDNCVYGGVKFLYLSPERLATDDFRARMERMKIGLIAVDEAHCISQWGYDFRPQYLKISEIRERLKNVPVIALTATATPEVTEDIQKQLFFKTPNVFKQSFARKNLAYVVRQSHHKNQMLLEILQKVDGSAIVYARSRRRTKEFADFLNKQKISADFYHAGLSPNERTAKQDSWITNKTRVICCTNAFGMGIDKPDVRTVVHIEPADSIEAYFQEAGRAGRDGQKAFAVLLTDEKDTSNLDYKIAAGFPSPDFIRSVYGALCRHYRLALHEGANRNFDFDLRAFAATSKLDALQVMAALKILEQQEIIYISDGVYHQSEVKATAGREAIHRFQQTNQNYEPLIKFILRTSEGVFENYVAIEEEAIAARLKTSLEDTITLLNGLNKFGILSYKPRREEPQLIFLKDRVPAENLRLDMAQINQRKENQLNRLKAVRFYITENNVCRSRVLLKYFGENATTDCGLCDVCIANKKQQAKGDINKFTELIENELRQKPLTLAQLKAKANAESDILVKALELLLDKGNIIRNPDSTFAWAR